MNIQGQELETIVNQNIDREWEYIKTISFPATREHTITIEQCEREYNRLKKNSSNWKTRSSIVLYFNKSINNSNKANANSPKEFWELLKSDKEVFRKFYTNRLKCSDWYKEKPQNWDWLMEGRIPEFIYGIGLTTSGMAPRVSYFKPSQQKYLIEKYANDSKEIFDPFAGFCGRLVGTVATGKKYIGWDISDSVIEENTKCAQWLSSIDTIQYELVNKDSLKCKAKYETLITCPPYSNANGQQIEEWRMSNGSKITCPLTCDEIIEYCLANFDCNKYIFVVDDSIVKYRDHIREKFMNTNYMNARNGSLTKASYNYEAIVVIEKE